MYLLNIFYIVVKNNEIIKNCEESEIIYPSDVEDAIFYNELDDSSIKDYIDNMFSARDKKEFVKSLRRKINKDAIKIEGSN